MSNNNENDTMSISDSEISIRAPETQEEVYRLHYNYLKRKKKATKEGLGDDDFLWFNCYGHLGLHTGKNIKADEVFKLIKAKIISEKGKQNVLTSHPLLSPAQEDMLWTLRDYVNKQ